MALFDAEALFRQADEARREDERAGSDDGSSDEDGEGGCREKPTITVDATGDIHVCFGARCPHVTLDRENNWVCHISGRVVGNEYAREQDPSWTGRCTGSANPDDSAGTPVGGWSKRRDMYAASVAAFRCAHSVSDAEVAPQPARQPTLGALASAKRGALCVDEVAAEPAEPKRARSTRRDNWTRDAIAKLATEAHGVIDKLFIVHAPAAAATGGPPLDPRLQNLDFVRPLALRSYVKACREGQQELNMDVITNVLVHANEFVRNQRARAAKQLQEAAAAARKRKASRTCLSGQVANLLAQLIVSLWRAACLTKHFQTAKKGSDSFQPFAAGVLYSLKRGLYLADGTCAVPALDKLAKHLPALRSATSTAAAKRLQSSSHRGICSIQRALASIAEMTPEEARPAMQLLHDASRQGAFLREMVSRNS